MKSPRSGYVNNRSKLCGISNFLSVLAYSQRFRNTKGSSYLQINHSTFVSTAAEPVSADDETAVKWIHTFEYACTFTSQETDIFEVTT